MDSSTSPLLLCPQLHPKDEKRNFIFDSSTMQKKSNLPNEFLWPHKDLAHASEEEFNVPFVDMEGFLRGNEEATAHAAKLVRDACLTHGFFQVTNHGVDQGLINAAYSEIDSIFKLPLSKKLSIKRKPGEFCGYSGAHADRYTSKLPWKETFSFRFDLEDDGSKPIVVDYFGDILGQDFQHAGWVYQKYCEAMKELSLKMMEILGISLGVDRMHYRKFFEDGTSMMRCNYYPTCLNSGLTLGTGPHCDPTSLTILHQDQVGGLEVFTNNKWLPVRPCQGALVINIGDTFMALSNGIYKSCPHRAVVNSERERKSLVFFLSPKEDKVVRPPQDLVCREGSRKYPDFTWSDLLEFTQKHYRADVATLQSFLQWIRSSQNTY